MREKSGMACTKFYQKNNWPRKYKLIVHENGKPGINFVNVNKVLVVKMNKLIM